MKMNKESFDFSLGISKKKKEDKSQFLNKAKKERVTREATRNEQKSALRIQAFYRGVRARVKYLEAFEQDVYKKFTDLELLQKKLGLDASKFSLIMTKAFRSYPIFLGAFVFYNQRSAKTHVQIIELITRNLIAVLTANTAGNADDNIISVLTDGDQSKENWAIYKLKKIFTLLMHLNFVEGHIQRKQFSDICRNWIQAVMPNKTDSDEMQLEDAKTTSKDTFFNITMQSLAPNIVENAVNYAECFEDFIYRKFVFQLISRTSNISNRIVFNKMTDLHVIPKALESLQEKSKIQFLNSYLQMGLVSHMVPDVKQFIHLEPLTITKNMDIAQKRVVKFLTLLKDSKSAFSKLPESNLLDLFNVIIQLTQEFEEAAVAKLGDKLHADFIRDVEFEEEKTLPIKQNSTVEKENEFSPVKAVRESNPLELDPEVLQNVLGFFSFTVGEVSQGQNRSNLTSVICKSILKLRSWLSNDQKNYLDNLLAFKFDAHVPLFRCVLETVKESNTNFILSHFFKQNWSKDYFINSTEKWLPILKLFCRVFHKKLMITDDEEFVGNKDIIDEAEQRNNIELRKIVAFSQFLNELIFQIVWDRLTKLDPAKKAAIKLLKELYNRDARLKFTKDSSFWNISLLSNVAHDLIQKQTHFKKDLIVDILINVPHMITFENRLKIFHFFVEEDKGDQDRFPYYSASDEEEITDKKIIRIRRSYILEDGYEFLAKRKNMKSIFNIKFINDLGIEEAGIDGGGLLKEFVSQLSKIAFDVNYGLFEEKEDKTLVPSPDSSQVEDHLKLFNFLGRMTGKAIYENILIEPMLSVIFLNRILRIPNTINELKYADQMLYKSLVQLKHKAGIVDTLGLTFSVSNNTMGVVHTHNLKENGDQIEVNESNKMEYIALLCKYRLNTQIDQQAKAFGDGLKSIVSQTWVQMFNHEELQLLICGSRSKGFNVSDLSENTEYNEYTANDQTIRDLWSVLEEISDEDKSLFLHFTTGCSRPPTLGFKYMQPKLGIAKSSFVNTETELLPSSSTCMNLLKLPDYRNKEKLRAKLIYAIRSNSGFEMG